MHIHKELNRIKEMKSCHKKLKFKTELDAVERALLYWNQNRFVNKPYECPECGKWHLTTSFHKKTHKRVIQYLKDVKRLEELFQLEKQYTK